MGARRAHLVLQPSNEPCQPADLGIQAVILGVRGAWERGIVMLTGAGPGRSPPSPDRGLASSPPVPVPVGGPGPIGTPASAPPWATALTRREVLSLLRSHELVVWGAGGSGAPGPGLHRTVAGPAMVLSAEGVGERTL